MGYSSVPTEEAEQIALFQWLNANNIPAFHVNNEMFTRSWKQRRRARLMGVQSGVPDVFVALPTHVIAIELKRKQGGVVSSNQKWWIDKLNKSNLPTIVAHGADEAIDFIKREMKS